ncbi:MAG: DUF115 domain-containing protein [Synergistaceae bacterium]|jgi:hypothetical protein|nr:DUF115 domain-containing protein [Synergistaceae bacterium]
MAKELHRAPEGLSVWESNMRELKARQPYLALCLDQYVKEHGHSFSHFENETPAGKWVEGLAGEPFFERGGEPSFNWGGRKKEDKNKPVFMLYGVGTPPYLFKAIRALPDAALSFIVVEPNMALIAYTLHMTHVYLALPSNCRLYFLTEGVLGSKSADGEEISDTLSFKYLLDECLSGSLLPVGIFAAALTELSAHPGEVDVWRDDFLDMGRSIREWVGVSLAYLGNSAEDTLLGLRQIVLLSHRVAFGTPLGLIKNKFGGRPAVAVAAGPSLDKNFMLLKDIQDKCVIIAADAVLRKLLSNGIVPHIVTSLERNILTYDLFFSTTVDEYRERCRDILLVSQVLCVPWTPCRWPGPVCLVYKQEIPVDRWFAGEVLGGSSLPMSGLSVAHMNYSIADYIDASSIAIIGQDLSFSEEGKSHAGDIGGSYGMDDKNIIEIPGALGGTVKTDRTWLSFLRFLETEIRVTKRPTWDCTEGGALIDAAEVMPFAEFIEDKIKNMEPMEKTPAEIVSSERGEVDVKEISERILNRIQSQRGLIEVIEGKLDEMEEFMRDAAAAGLEPARRIAYAAKADAKLDEIHAVSSVFDFIGQSYTRLASIELALTRTLDEVVIVERWYALHREILDSHRAIASFTRKWLSYAEQSIEYWGSKGVVDMTPLEPDDALEMAHSLLERLAGAEGEEMPGIQLELDSVMMRCDPIPLGWPGYIMWNYAMLLMNGGRAALATRFMEAAAEYFDGMEMPVSEMALFFKDYARILAEPDLTHVPDHMKAETMLANAADLGGVDDEIREILSGLLDSEVSYSVFDATTALGAKGGSPMAGWFRERSAAQRALYEGDLIKTLSAVWRAVVKYWRALPSWAASHLRWLAETLEKCEGVDDVLLRETVDRILSEMALDHELLGALHVGFTEKFIRMLVGKGLRVSLIENEAPADRHEGGDDFEIERETADVELGAER